MPVAEGHGCGHSEPSLEVTVELACHIFRLGNIRQNSACALVVGDSRLGEAQPPCGSVKHAGAETTLKRKNPAANNGFCYAELLRRAGEASHLHRADEDRHVIEDAHKRSIFTKRSYRSEVVGRRNHNANSNQSLDHPALCQPMLLHMSRQSFDVVQGTDVIHVQVGTHQNHLTLAIAAVRLSHSF